MALKARALYDFNSENPGEISVKENENSESVQRTGHRRMARRVQQQRRERTLPRVLRRDPEERYRVHVNNNSTSGSRYANIPTGGFGDTSSYKIQNQTDNLSKTSATSPGFTAFSPPFPAPQQQHIIKPARAATKTGTMTGDDSSTVADEPGVVGGSYQGDFDGNGPSTYRVSTSTSRGGNAQQAKSSATVSRNLNRFSTFVKSGGEAFVLGEAAGFVKDGDKICVVTGTVRPRMAGKPVPLRLYHRRPHQADQVQRNEELHCLQADAHPHTDAGKQEV
ncbi:hypothetical protein J4Q44_G00228540 [Coregonus suidteri]|uniref:Uncharacterized protein n=1 Tax=Coregonus suidteri TaxID=861788 RepID=A0AAN8QHD8_9TELE